MTSRNLSREDRARKITFVLCLELSLNWSIALLKIFFGLMTQCMVIVADGIHSFSDGTSNIVALVGISISKHPPDKKHPYGHRKYETFASLLIALFLFVAAVTIVREAIVGLMHERTPEVTPASFVVIGGTFLVNLFTVWYERRKAKELHSELLESDAWHTTSDIFVTCSVFVALIGIRLNFPKLDSLFSFVIAGVIVYAAIKILKHGSDILCDSAVVEAEKIEKIVKKIKGVLDCHEIRTRGSKDHAYVDLHVLVASEMTVEDSHHLANLIEKKIRADITGVQDVVVHIEPISHQHEGLEHGS